MWRVLSLFFIFLFNCNINRACKIEFHKLDTSHTIRHVYEQGLFNITGQLQYCPSSMSIRNVSIGNPSLKRIIILKVTYFIETNRIHITALARLVGFAPLNIELYFEDENHLIRLIRRSTGNITIEQKACSRAASNHKEILRKCPTLRFDHGYYILTENITVAIKRRQTIIDALFTGVVMVLLTVGRLCIGCDLEIKQIVKHFKRPIPLLIGFGCQVIYLPLLSACIAKIFQLDQSTSLGLLSTASSPGGSSSNIYTALLAGDVDLSVTMTFLSTISAFGTFPFWIWLLGKNYVDFETIKFPWWSMILSLFTLVTPAVLGLLLRRYRPVLAFRIGRFLNPIAVGYLVFILTFGVYINMYIFYIIDLKAIIACCFLPWFGFVGGAIISIIGIGDKKKTIAICIETGVQNTAVAIFFLRLTFPQPESDIALATPILVAMAIPIPFLVLALTKSLLKKCTCLEKYFSKKEEKKINENGIEHENPEKTIIKELLEEKEHEEAAQIEKSPM